jgi:hypothetical protein
VGGTANPLLHPIELQFLAPSLTMPLIEVPELGELEIRVLDAAGFELEGASVKGWGRDGGRVDAVTDVRGTCVARFLPPGPYSLIVEHPEHGSARRRTELRRSERAEVEIRLGE